MLTPRLFAALLLVPLLVLLPLMAQAQARDAAPRITAPRITPDAASLALDDIGLYRVGYALRGKPEVSLPVGWTGGLDSPTGAACQSAGTQNGREAWLLHPPWRGETGVTFQEFTVALPRVSAITLHGATALRESAAGKSDGVAFRVFVNGKPRLEVNQTDSAWKPFTLDLTAEAGQTVTVRFETDPGPQNNSSFDFALWGGRTLEMKGYKPRLLSHPNPPPLDLRRLAPRQNGSAAPPSGFAGKTAASVTGDRAALTYRGLDGTLSYTWTRPRTSADPPLGSWRLQAKLTGDVPVEVPLAGGAEMDWTQAATLTGSHLQAVPGGAACVSTYTAGGQSATVTVAAHLQGKSLVLDVSCDKPLLRGLDGGGWGPTLRRRVVTEPYYSGQVQYLAQENLFVNAFLDWTASTASSQQGTRAVYDARTDGTRSPLRERLVYVAAWHAAETLPNLPNPPSPFRAHLGGKIVLDVWGGRFEEIARRLETLHQAGLTGCVVIIHDWQRSGYDNALPAHVPANPNLGGEAGMKILVGTAKRLGYDIALHENYVDYYPNYEGFSPDEIALDSDGKRVTAWYNPGTKIQSFAVQPHAILKLAREQSGQILARYAPNADYLDVHSAVPPWFHVDDRADAAGAAAFRTVWEAHRALWAFERKNYGGPVLGEGNNHWYWSGLLDGVEAQFGQGWSDSKGRDALLAVDFDLLKMHPLQFNHGMGYYERWWGQASWGAMPPMEVLDQYRMQEISYGHAGFLGSTTYAAVPLAWLEHHLMTPVTARYASAKPVTIQYQLGGRWVDGTQAAKAGRWSRVRVGYDNGLTVTANNDPQPLRAGAVTLPQYGWLAEGAGVTAWTALRQGVIADYARTASSTFANARRAADWDTSGIHRVQPEVAQLRQTGPRAFEIAYAWKLGEPLPVSPQCFVHFVDSGDKIVFQNDHALPRSGDAEQTLRDGPYALHLPESLPDGDYSIRIGLLGPDGGRLSLQGRDDGGSRIAAGTLHVADAGQKLTFTPEPPAPDSRAIHRRRLNTAGTIIDFGDVRTNGSVLVRREGGEWVLRTLPHAGEFSLELRDSRFGHPASASVIHGWWRMTLTGASEYRWK